MKNYVQYGCGLSAPKEWINFDSSPTLRIQKTPILGFLLSNKLNTNFPENVKYGDIIKGLPVGKNSCDGVYCSHVLEHLSYQDFHYAIKNTYDILKPKGIFRLVMPDLNNLIDSYIENKKNGIKQASVKFIKNSGMGLESRQRGVKALLESTLGNSRHQWLWDLDSTIIELEKIGFKEIKECKFGDSKDKMFKFVEEEGRFHSAVAIQMTK